MSRGLYVYQPEVVGHVTKRIQALIQSGNNFTFVWIAVVNLAILSLCSVDGKIYSLLNISQH